MGPKEIANTRRLAFYVKTKLESKNQLNTKVEKAEPSVHLTTTLRGVPPS